MAWRVIGLAIALKTRRPRNATSARKPLILYVLHHHIHKQRTLNFHFNGQARDCPNSADDAAGGFEGNAGPRASNAGAECYRCSQVSVIVCSRGGSISNDGHPLKVGHIARNCPSANTTTGGGFREGGYRGGAGGGSYGAFSNSNSKQWCVVPHKTSKSGLTFSPFKLHLRRRWPSESRLRSRLEVLQLLWLRGYSF